MATKLQEARQRVRDAEAARTALAAKQAAEIAAQEPAKVALERYLKRNNAPIIVFAAGSHRVYQEGVVSLSGYGWSGEIRRAAEGLKGKAREDAAFVVISTGAVKYNLGGASLKCKGLAQKLRVVTGTHLSAWKRAHEKVVKAERAWREAQREETAAILSAYEAGDRMTADQIAAISARMALLKSAVQITDQWSRERAVKDARIACEEADQHLAHVLSKSTDPCPCTRCAGDRAEAEYNAKAEAKRKEREKADAAMQKIKDRAPWRKFTCPACGGECIAQVLPHTRWDGTVGPPSLRCTQDRCHQSYRAEAIKSTPAKKPEAVTA